ncbi:sce7726 family protein [Actinopolymorpha sp. NPDC004070]|uniref:sce7726 family protein n=1 Tax=Actinopolymorpha sp. NPDC004070 TaxID=3154548 RepID=UPI00339DE87D
MVTEAAVRQSLLSELLADARPPVETVFEFWVPRSNERADVAAIGATIDGFEIKTDRDSLRRLPRQASAYARVFDRCHAVLAPRHVSRALDILPPWWGVRIIEDGPTLPTLRPAALNGGVDPETLVRILWRDEAYTALCSLGEPPDPSAGRFQMWEKLLTLLDVEALKRLVREALLDRNSSWAGRKSSRHASPAS